MKKLKALSQLLIYLKFYPLDKDVNSMAPRIISNNTVPAQLYFSNFFPVEKVSSVDVVTFVAGVGPIKAQIETYKLRMSGTPHVTPIAANKNILIGFAIRKKF